MHQSGTHWLKFMLASAIADHYAIDPPRYNHANDIIGGLKDRRAAAAIPDLRSTHSIPPLISPLLLAGKLLRLPPTVLLVRDLRASLVSNYRKWCSRYAVSFAEFLRGDPSGRRYNSDIWWCIRFHNAWGRLAGMPGSPILIVRYEDLRARPHEILTIVAGQLRLPLSAAAIERGVDAATKPAMLARADPKRPPGEVHEAEDDPLQCYGAAERAFVKRCCSTFLHHTFGYDFSDFGS